MERRDGGGEDRGKVRKKERKETWKKEGREGRRRGG